ncbi:MAG: mandelate racemase/muconate lactonizing enzyme family protein [Bryobacterales bacterium]
MRISEVRTHHLRAELEEPFRFSQFTYTAREAMLVEVRTDEGITGWGEAYGPAVLSSAAVEKFFAPMLLGRDPRDVEAIWAYLYARSVDYGQKGVMLAGISAIDIALWDIKAQATGQPLYRLLGGEQTETIECYATGFYFTDSEPLEDRFEKEAKRYLADGFRAMKVKVGLGPERDAELIRHVREVIGPGATPDDGRQPRLHPHRGAALARRVEDCDIGWFEEPVSAIDPEAYCELKARTAIPLAGGECEYTRFGFDRWFRLRALDYCQPDLCSCGGITEGLKIATLASLTGVHVTPHAWGSAVGQAAALHFYAARPRQPFTLTPERKLIECDRSENPFRTAIVREPVAFAGGRWTLPQTPGLGIEVRPECFEAYRT